ncbi:hypothetical protein CEW92_05235 [Bacillaceae bacterium SAS-127]|nr:hypothetical protein CEW92_05235 [Bacillaceae bacterium SAS-127]
MEIKHIISLIKEEVPNKAIDLAESLELLKETISDTLNEIHHKSNMAFQDRDISRRNELNQLIDQIIPLESEIEKFVADLDVDDEKHIIGEMVEEADKRILPNYADYYVDTNVEYTLYEDYTHKRPWAFRMNDQNVIKVTTWKEMLIKTCELLITVDEEKMMTFEKISRMNGRKRKYFSLHEANMTEPILVSGKIYVETHMNSNGFRNLIIKLLKEYDFKVSEFKIYLKADYTNMAK